MSKPQSMTATSLLALGLAGAVAGCPGPWRWWGHSPGGGGSGDSDGGRVDPDAGAVADTICGGLPGFPCDEGQYCNYPESTQCGSGDQNGSCSPVPEVCTKELNEVCGCDGTTYANPCLAAAASTSILRRGRCDEPAFCGGFAGIQCTEPNEYCEFPESTNCGSGDQAGTCQPIPEVCTFEYVPVCGCDGTTYPNRCAAAASGVSVTTDGECP